MSGAVGWQVKIEKRDDDQQVVFGWLYQTRTKLGKLVVDHSGEFIRTSTLEKAAYTYVLESRNAGEMHGKGEDGKLGVGSLVESFMSTREKRAAMGIPEGILPDGMWVGYKVHDADTWKRIKSGELVAFSLGGSAEPRDRLTSEIVTEGAE